MFGDFTLPSAIPKSSRISLVQFPLSEFESSSMDVNTFEKFWNAQSGLSPLLYFDLLRNTVCFTAESVLNQWNSRVHRILVSTLAIHSATEPPSISSIVPATLFAELYTVYRIMSEHSIPLADQLLTIPPYYKHSSSRSWRDQLCQRGHRSLCPQSSNCSIPLSPIALH